MIRTACGALMLTLLVSGWPATGQDAAKPLAVALEPTDKAYLYEVMRHLYRWYLDEDDVLPGMQRGRFVFWVRELKLELDEGDNSRFVEIILPDIGVQVRAKRSDYRIPELDVDVRSDTFRITNVARIEPLTVQPAGAVVVKAKYKAMRDYLFRTRDQLKAPDAQLLERLRAAAQERTRNYLAERNLPMPEDDQTIHLGPLSPVANETWVYWEQGRVLYRFSADIALDNPAFWEHETLGVDLYSIDEQVVVSLDEVAGSNAYMTRDQAGRVLFNCMVFGRRVVLTTGPQ